MGKTSSQIRPGRKRVEVDEYLRPQGDSQKRRLLGNCSSQKKRGGPLALSSRRLCHAGSVLVLIRERKKIYGRTLFQLDNQPTQNKIIIKSEMAGAKKGSRRTGSGNNVTCFEGKKKGRQSGKKTGPSRYSFVRSKALGFLEKRGDGGKAEGRGVFFRPD